jgi:ribose 5-phosphate isomerase B
MKRFSLITEADAQRLEPGTTVALRPGGHITPLARDTLRERRIDVVTGEPLDASAVAGLAPVAAPRRVALGADHTGLALKRALAAHLRGAGLAVHDLGTDTADPVDYPDIAARVAGEVARGEAEAGIVIDGAGIGSAIAANKVAGVRAAMCPTPTIARYAREHNGANVLTLGATLLSQADAFAIVDTWLSAAMTEPRYIKRLEKIARLETRGRER